MPQLDEFLLGRSPTFSLPSGAEQQENLALLPNPDLNFATVFGLVSAGGLPVNNATVKLLTLTGDPVAHATSNESGLYAIRNVPPGAYQLVAITAGYAVSAPQTFTLSPRAVLLVNISLTGDPRTQLSNVFGLILNSETAARIAGATVALTLPDSTIVSITSSNADGQFLLCAVANGSYLITASKNGFDVLPPIPVALTGPSIVRSDLFLTPSSAVQGTVHGFIRDQGGAPLASAFVGLYSVLPGGETLIRTVLTNVNGLYLIGEVAAGTYLVKAKRQTASDPLFFAGVAQVA